MQLQYARSIAASHRAKSLLKVHRKRSIHRQIVFASKKVVCAHYLFEVFELAWATIVLCWSVSLMLLLPICGILWLLGSLKSCMGL